MNEDSTRRDFLKAAGAAMAAVVGTALFPRDGWAQEEKEKPEEEQKPEEGQKEEPDYDALFENGDSGEEETRACPQCGALMYRQGRTWTCENCGYSYVE